jgi:hypothetical protein
VGRPRWRAERRVGGADACFGMREKMTAKRINFFDFLVVGKSENTFADVSRFLCLLYLMSFSSCQFLMAVRLCLEIHTTYLLTVHFSSPSVLDKVVKHVSV